MVGPVGCCAGGEAPGRRGTPNFLGTGQATAQELTPARRPSVGDSSGRPAQTRGARRHSSKNRRRREIVGADKVRRDPPLNMGSEDFSFMLEQVPGCYLNVGNGNGDGEGVCEVHNPSYDFNDDALPYGSSFFVRAVETWLAP